MTLSQLNLVTRTQIANLHVLSKRQFMAYMNNILCIVINDADLITGEIGTPEQRIEAAHSIARTGRRCKQELDELFAERQPESIGVQEKA